jgi:hypothetical protein
MSWQRNLDKSSREVLNREALLQERQIAFATQQDPTIAERIAYINQRAPWIAAPTQIALARSYASDAAIDKIAEFAGRNIVDRRGQVPELERPREQYAVVKNVPAQEANVQSNGEGPSLLSLDSFYSGLKGIARVAGALGQIAPEAINNAAAVLNPGKTKSQGLQFFKEYAESFSIYQLAANWSDQGSGFYMADELVQEQAKAARKFRGTINNGSAFSVGRGAAVTVGLEEGLWYNVLSGTLDLITQLTAPDPTRLIVKGTRSLAQAGKAGVVAGKLGVGYGEALQSARGNIPLLSRNEALAYRRAVRSQAGLQSSLSGMSLDVQKWNRFMDSNATAVKVVDDLAREKSLYNIYKMYDFKLTPEQALELQKADTAEKVKYALVNGYAIGKNTLTTNIYDIRPGFSQPAKYLLKRSPLKRSRLLTNLPESQIVINGDDYDRASAMKNFSLSLKGAGASDDEIAEFLETASKNFLAKSSADDQRDAYKIYEQLVSTVLNKNGVRKEVVDDILRRPRQSMEKLRSIMIERSGIPTDHKFMGLYGSLLKNHLPPTVYNDFIKQAAEVGGSAHGIVRPMQLSELFDRVQTLPDYREIRRLTNNPFISEALNNVPKVIRKPTMALTTKRRLYEDVETILDPARYEVVQSEIRKLAGRKRSALQEAQYKQLLSERESLVEVSDKRLFSGEQRGYLTFLDHLQNRIWKPLNLATIGYILRNAMDAQLRMAFGAQTGILNHPFQYMALVVAETKESNKLNKLFRKAGFSMKNRSILGETLVAYKNAEGLRREHAELLNFNMRQQGLGMHTVGTHLRATNNWRPVSKLDGEEQYIRGVLQQVRLANKDELQKTIARSIAFGGDIDEAVEEAVRIAKTPEVFKDLNGIYKRGVPFKSVDGVEAFGPPIDLRSLSKAELDDWLRNHIKTVVVGNVQINSGNLQEVAFMQAFDRVGRFDEIQTVPVSSVKLLSGSPKPVIGQAVTLKNGDEAIISGISGSDIVVIPTTGKSVTTLPNGSFNYYGTKEARSVLRRAPMYDKSTNQGLPQYVQKEIYEKDGTDKGLFAGINEGLDQFTDKIFGELYGKKWVKTTERSPVFRKFYYDEVAQRLDQIDPNSAKKLLKKLETNAKRDGYDNIAEYIGDKKVAAQIEKIAKSGKGGKVKMEDLDDYARLMALQKTKELLYDASARSNLEDILRITMPFVTAWREIIGRWTSLMIEDPSIAARFNRFSHGLTQADPDQDGRGFFYKDPQSDQMYFQFPSLLGLGNAMNLYDTDVLAEAPVSQLSQGISWMPGIGPLAQIPASFILRNTPDTSQLVQVILPYGKTSTAQEVAGAFNPLPGTLTKTADLISSLAYNREDDMNSTFARTYIEVLRALSSTGEFDLNTEDGLKALKSKAKREAQTISMMRIIQQFLGPTSPQIGMKVESKGLIERDVYVDEMTKVLEKFQTENYDTAIQRFEKVFGEEMTLYIGSKTKTIVPGLEASREFGEWEFANGDLFTEYPDVAAYFAPSGSEFNFDVYERQRQQGKRVRLTDDELIELAQKRIGSSRYRAARKLFGANLTGMQRTLLDNYRAELNREYPGFPRYAEFTVGEFPNTVEELNKIIRDPRVSDNKLTAPLTKYLELRNQYYASLGVRSLQSQRASYAKAHLRTFGEDLSEQSPEFARIWQRVLAQEVED